MVGAFLECQNEDEKCNNHNSIILLFSYFFYYDPAA